VVRLAPEQITDIGRLAGREIALLLLGDSKEGSSLNFCVSRHALDIQMNCINMQ